MIEFWYQALHHPIGVAVKTDDVETLRAKLYALRRQAADPALDALALVVPVRPGVLWIVHKSVRKEDAQD